MGSKGARMRCRPILPAIACVLQGLALPALSMPAQAAQCSFFDAQTDELLDGPCSVEFDGHAEIITIGERRVVFVQSARQGQWSTGTLDGEPAVRYETNRAVFSYATQDLTRFVDRTDE